MNLDFWSKNFEMNLTILFLFWLSSAAQYVVKGTSHSSSSFIRQPNMCVPIPVDLKLCRNVGYDRMVLPNLLNHESLDEVRQQAASFVPLLSQNCHQHLKEFLCSLFAPVCLPPDMSIFGPIPPCKSLCKSVERSCSAVMKRFNFDWPPMLNCSKFTEREPCIRFDDDPRHRNKTLQPDPGICAPCGTELEVDTLHDHYCASEFVVKMKIKKVILKKKSRGIRTLVAESKRRVVYKTGPLNRTDLKRMRLVVKGLKRCECPLLDDALSKTSRRNKKGRKNKAFYLAMGRKVGKKLFVTVLHKWPKRNKVLGAASRDNFGAGGCPDFGSIVSS